MRYVKIALATAALLLTAALIALAVRVAREAIMGGARAMYALGNSTLEAPEEEIAPQSAETPVPYGQGGGHIDPDAEMVPGATYGNVVYGTENLDLFEVPVDVEADMLPAGE